MKRYISLKCNTCARQKDELVDLVHYTPDRCTITLNCEGRLLPIGFTSDGSTILDVPPAGVSNWYPRGTALSNTKAVSTDVLYDTSTGQKQQVILAVSNNELGYTPSSDAKIFVKLFAEQQTAKDYRQYTYRRNVPFTIINGVEDNQAKKVLRYSIVGANPDQVEVYLNGVKKTRSVDYDLYDGTVNSAVPPNSVLFLSTITGSSTQVDIIVTKASAISEVQLAFIKTIDDESRVNLGAWEGVNMVTSPSIGDWSLFYCDFSEVSSTFTIDVKLTFNEATIVNTIGGSEFPVPLSAVLLSRTKLFTQLDRQRAKCIPLNELNGNNHYMIVKSINGVRSLLITEAAAIDLFPVLDVVRFDAHTLQKTNLTGNADAAELDNELIIGPDA